MHREPLQHARVRCLKLVDHLRAPCILQEVNVAIPAPGMSSKRVRETREQLPEPVIGLQAQAHNWDICSL